MQLVDVFVKKLFGCDKNTVCPYDMYKNTIPLNLWWGLSFTPVHDLFALFHTDAIFFIYYYFENSVVLSKGCAISVKTLVSACICILLEVLLGLAGDVKRIPCTRCEI